MAGFTQARQQAILDAEFVTGDDVQYSENGSSESSNLAATNIDAWDSATAADPSVKANTNALLSAAASGGCTITHFRVTSDGGSTPRTDWTALDSSRALLAGDKLNWAAGALEITLD